MNNKNSKSPKDNNEVTQMTIEEEIKMIFDQSKIDCQQKPLLSVMKKRKILVVDENILNCETMDSILMVMNLEDRVQTVEYALDGLQALKAIRYANLSHNQNR